MKLTLNISDSLKSRLDTVSSQFGISPKELLLDALENFLPLNNIPNDFISNCGANNIIRKGIPVRSILPFTASYLGHILTGQFDININGCIYKIDPYPTYGFLCGVKIIERLHQLTKQIACLPPKEE